MSISKCLVHYLVGRKCYLHVWEKSKEKKAYTPAMLRNVLISSPTFTVHWPYGGHRHFTDVVVSTLEL